MTARYGLRRTVLFLLAVGEALGRQELPCANGAEALVAKQRAAELLVREALQRESYGLAHERTALLAAAAERDPLNAAAHWQQGLVRDGFGKWVRPERLTFAGDVARVLAEYRRVRDAAADNVDSNLRLANWSAEHALPAQERAHLTRVLMLEPENIEARRRLGYLRVGDDWFSAAEAEAEVSRLAKREADLAEYSESLREIQRDLQHRSRARQQAGRQRLEQIVDPQAIPAIEAVLGSGSETEAYCAVEIVGHFEVEAATQALCRFALLSSSPAVRSAAAELLKNRDFHHFVPEMLDLLQLPLQTQYAAASSRDGTIHYQHVVVREGRTKRDVALLSTQIAPRVMVREVVTPRATLGRRAGEQLAASTRELYLPELQEALQRAAQTASDNEALVRYQNTLVASANRRVMETLTTATGQTFIDPESWWQWWLNEVDRPSPQKRVAVKQKTQFLGFKKTAVASVAYRASSCFAAGTQVWTIDGQQAIEMIRVGDLVLSKNIESGELCYKPVLHTTIRPLSPQLLLAVGEDTISTTQGHLFWSAGDGWKQARHLEQGSLLHAAAGPVRLGSVKPGPPAETYNLVVADFNTYFVGDSKLLSHDVTEQQSTDICTPGLVSE